MNQSKTVVDSGAGIRIDATGPAVRALVFWLASLVPLAAAQLDVAYYPYERKVRAVADLAGIPAAERVTHARFVLTKPGSPDPLATGSAAPVPNLPRRHNEPSIAAGRFAQAILDTPNLPTGEYVVTMTLEGSQGLPAAPLTRTFQRQVYEWEHNEIGLSRRVIPPFTPLNVRGRVVESVLRAHMMNNFGLWEQVVAKGKPILAGPIRFEFVVPPLGGPAQIPPKGGTTNLALKPGRLRFTERRPDRVVAQSAFRGGKVTSEFDYDGMMKVTLDLAATSKTVDSFTLAIPLRASVASLMHICGDSIRGNYAGRIPAGNGIVWQSQGANSTRAGYGGIWGTFMPYIWLGGPERGLCWFADSDRDWSLDDEKSALDIVREGETVTLRVHLFNKPTVLDRPRRIVFGLQATPVKPLPDGWRSWYFHGKLQGALDVRILGQSLMWGAVEGDGEVYPRGRDFAIFDQFARDRKVANAFLGWAEKSGWLDGYPDQSRREEYRSNVISGLAHQADGDKVILYTDPRGSEDSQCEECLLFNPRPMGVNVWDEPAPSWQDFALFYFKQMVVRGGIDGLYFDNLHARSNFDTISADAYVRADGTLQPSLGIWNMRNLVKRAAVMFHEQGRTPCQVVHMTNGNIIPVLSFATVALDWEDKYGATDFQDRWPADFFLAESIGRQAGLVPVGLGGSVTTNAAEFTRLTRTQLGVALVHEIKLWSSQFDSDEMRRVYQKLFDFGYGLADCRVWPYWEDQPVKISGANARALVLNRAGKTLLVVTNFGEAGEATIAVDGQRLGWPAGFIPRDIETGEKLPFAGEVFRLPLKKHDFRLVFIE